MRKKLTIFGLSLALVLSMILISVGQQPMILPGFNLTDLVDVNAATPSDGYVITWDSATAKWIPAASGGGAGDVTGPGASTDNAIATYHLATGKIIQQNHSVLIDDSSNISGVNQITVPTIYGSVASGGDLTLYSTSHATLGQIKLESDLETDRWLDQATNTFVGVDVVGAGNLAHVAGDTGYFNSAFGASALYSNTTGYLNSAFGHYALYSNTIGYWNSALGKSALRCNTEGHSNVASGMNALYSNTTGDNNSALGYSAGRYQNDGTSAFQTPENSVYLGALAKSGSDPAGGEDAITNEIVIGYDATGAGANTVTLGNASIVSTILRGQVDVNSGGASGEIGIDFNSISSTYSTICQSDAEGIASSSDLRIGLDETLRTLIICDRGDIATDFGMSASNNPMVRLYNAAHSYYLGFDYNTIVSNTQLDILSGTYFEFKINNNLPQYNAYYFMSNADAYSLTDTDAEQAWMYLKPKINQTSTAGYIGLLMDVTETSTGSGTNALMDLRVATASKFRVYNDGELETVSHYGTMQTATGDGATTVDWGLGNIIYFTFGAANETFTFTAPANKGKMTLIMKQDATGSRTATWPATVLWPGNVAPTLSTGAADVDIVTLIWDGTNYFGLFNGDFS